MLSITRTLAAGIELNWLPPTDPNGEVHYVIYYTPEGGTEQSIDNAAYHNVLYTVCIELYKSCSIAIHYL